MTEIDEDTQAAFEMRQHLVRLLVKGVTLQKAAKTEVRITYRFDPPDEADQEDSVVGGVRNSPGL